MSDEFSTATRWSTFVLGDETFGLRVEDVQEVLLLPPITPVPRAPPHILGLINLRGQVMAALDVRGRLACPPRKRSTTEKLLVLNVSGMLVSMVVDEIGDVVELAPERWQPIPETLPPEQRYYVTGLYPLDGKLVLGLRMPALIADERPASQ